MNLSRNFLIVSALVFVLAFIFYSSSDFAKKSNTAQFFNFEESSVIDGEINNQELETSVKVFSPPAVLPPPSEPIPIIAPEKESFSPDIKFQSNKQILAYAMVEIEADSGKNITDVNYSCVSASEENKLYDTFRLNLSEQGAFTSGLPTKIAL